MSILNHFALATLDALSAHIALVSLDGTIIAVNQAWRRFAEKNSARSNVMEGSNYFSTCERVRGEDKRDADAILDGLRAVLDGQQDFYVLQYPCHAPHEKRWFEARITRFSSDEGNYAVIAHENVTERVLAEQERFQHTKEVVIAEERQRLSRELHDGVTQTLYSTTILADSVQHIWEKKPERAREQLRQIATLNRAALTEMRSLLYELRPETLLSANLVDLIGQLAQAAMGRKAIAVQTSFTGEKVDLPPDIQLAIYRVGQEAINNVIKHSQATRMTVAMDTQPDSVSLQVADNGIGFDMSKSHAGLGLVSMKERVAAIGAFFEFMSQIGSGTQINLVWKAS